MNTARLLESGNDQFVELPTEYQFEGNEVALKRIGNGVLLMPLNQPWAILEAGLATFEPDFTVCVHR